jgi:hypothetical protein
MKLKVFTIFFFASWMCGLSQIRIGMDIARAPREPERGYTVSRSSTLLTDSIRNIAATYRAGQVFVTWDNLGATGIRYTLYRSATPIQHGHQLASAVNLGQVRDNSGYNQRLSEIMANSVYLKTDSASSPLASTRGLFVATSTVAGSFYYAVTPTVAGIEDTTIVPGSNATSTPVVESVTMPEPVWQTRWTLLGRSFDIYALYCTKVVSAVYPLMVNVGSYPMHFAVSKGSGDSPAPTVVLLHPDDSHFLDATKLGFWNPDPNECIVTIDDWLPDRMGVTTCFYGYHENYDIYSSSNPVPTSGVVFDYTFARVKHTVDWVVRHLPVDSTRMSVAGLSGGAIGALFTALMLPTRFASAVAIATQCDMSSMSFASDNMHWGTPQSNLPTNDGLHRNTRLNAGFLAGMYRSRSMPILFTFCGKRDQIVGWTEKIPFYDSLNRAHHGGFHFWDQTNHNWNNSPWKTGFGSFAFIHRYRKDRSYPAFSNCSLNSNPGNGTPASGDAAGTINGMLDWSDQIVDTQHRWEDTLRTRSLVNIDGIIAAPDSGTTDVTLRRLQKFAPPAGSMLVWKNIKDSVYNEDTRKFENGIIIQEDSTTYGGGPFTIPAFKIFKTSSRLMISWHVIATGVGDAMTLPSQCMLEQNYPNPFNPSTTIGYQLSHASLVMLTVYDVLGRVVATLVNETKPPGTYTVHWDASGMPSGIYFYRLQAGNFSNVRKFVLVK